MPPLPSYEPVPDVEQPDDDGFSPADVIIAKAQERYPEAGSQLEAEFLGRLDDAIEKAEPKITLPRVTAEQLQTMSKAAGEKDGDNAEEISDTKALVHALKLPTAALGVTIASALLLLVVNSPLAKAIYPYYACILTFLASVPDIRRRFLKAVRPVFAKAQGQKEVVERKVDGVATRGLNYLGITEDACNRALAPIRDKLSFATKAETALRQIDPSIDIPDMSDIEKSFDGYETQLKTAFDGMQDAVDFSKSLPAPMQSLAKYQVYVLIPFLAFMLGLQLYGVYTTSTKTAAGGSSSMDASSDNVMGTVRLFASTVSNVTTFAPSENPTAAPTVVATDEESEWLEMWIAIQTYVSTVIQIMVAFIVTQVRTMAALLNSQISVIERKTNRQLKAKVGDTFDKIFKKGFGTIRTKFLDLVRKIDKIEGPINQIKDKIPGGGNLGGIAANVQNVGGSLLGRFGKK